MLLKFCGLNNYSGINEESIENLWNVNFIEVIELGIFSCGIAFLHLSFSVGSFGKQSTLALLTSSKFHQQSDTLHLFPIIHEYTTV